MLKRCWRFILWRLQKSMQMDLMTILPNLGFGELNRRKSRIWATILLLLCGTTVIVNVGLLQALSSLISLWICLTKMIFASNSSRIGLRVLARRKKNSGFLISSGIMSTAADRWLSCVPTKCCWMRRKLVRTREKIRKRKRYCGSFRTCVMPSVRKQVAMNWSKLF